jgi:hypothetical protein
VPPLPSQGAWPYPERQARPDRRCCDPTQGRFDGSGGVGRHGTKRHALEAQTRSGSGHLGRSEPCPHPCEDRVDSAHVLHVSRCHTGLVEDGHEQIVPRLVRGIGDKRPAIEVTERGEPSFGTPMVGGEGRKKRLAHVTDRIELYRSKVRLSELVNSLKGASSGLLKVEFPEIPTFWSVRKGGSALLSPSYLVDGAPLEIVRQYIENQGRSARRRERRGSSHYPVAGRHSPGRHGRVLRQVQDAARFW